MMFTLAISFNRRVRVWLDDLPQAVFEPEFVVEHSLSASHPPHGGIRRAAVELLAPKGARIDYGLLGAVYTPRDGSKLGLQVNGSSPSNKKFADSMAGSVDSVYIGLPREYTAGVIEGAVLGEEHTAQLPSGIILFNCAAHGFTGSSRAVFKDLGRIVTKLLNAPKMPHDQLEIESFFN